ncbi:MAG: ribosome silencing factor [Candidatus Kapaibacterium sp.]
MSYTAEELARRCAEMMVEKKARDIVMLDVGELTDIADFFVICSCDNDTQVKAVAENIREELGKIDVRPWKTEGWQGLHWIILDYVEVVVHVFYGETRHFYKLERLWADARIEYITDQAGPAPTLDNNEST